MATDRPYYDPYDFGCFDLATSSIDKTFRFDWDTDVIAGAKAVATYQGHTVATYTVGSGITIENANRRVTITISGAPFVKYAGRTIDVSCSFFVEGDVEVIFQIKIIKSPL